MEAAKLEERKLDQDNSMKCPAAFSSEQPHDLDSGKLHNAGAVKEGGCPFHKSDSARSSANRGHIRFSDDTMAGDMVDEDDRPSKVKKGTGANTVSVQKIVRQLYNRVLADERISQFYKGAHMQRIYDMQMKIMTMMFGDEEVSMSQIHGIDLRRAHMPYILKMGLGNEHWVIFCDHFKAVLDENHAMSEDAKVRALALMESTASLFRPVEDGELEKLGLGLDGRRL